MIAGGFLMIAINKKILDFCEERAWSTYELAQRTGITHSTLNSFINRDTAPKIETLERICEAFGITLAQFFSVGEETEILTETECKLIHSYRAMSKEKQDALIKLLVSQG